MQRKFQILIKLLSISVLLSANSFANQQQPDDVFDITKILAQRTHVSSAQLLPFEQSSVENSCIDKLDSCVELANSNVCETSKDAMVINCPQTCNFCGMFENY